MSEQKLTDLRIELLELEIARQKAPKPKEHILASPIILAIAGATVTALVSVVGNLAQLDANRKLERGRLESALILKATEARTAQERIDGLKFLVKAGLIADVDKKISLLKPDEVPQIQSDPIAGNSSFASSYPSPATYRQLFDSAALLDESASMVASYGKRLLQGRPRYEVVAAKTGIPWFVIGVLHLTETTGRFDVHMHNGDPLTERTTHVPSGRPLTGTPPFTWEDSAIDAMKQAGLTNVKNWTIEETLFQIERFNGFGYWHHGVYSPYLWGGSNHYKTGRFINDATFDPTAKSLQIGAAVLLKFAVPIEDLSKLSTTPAR